MRVVLDSLVSVVTGVFDLGEADLATIGINMVMGLSMFLPMTVGQLSFGQAGFMSIGAHVAAQALEVPRLKGHARAPLLEETRRSAASALFRSSGLRYALARSGARAPRRSRPLALTRSITFGAPPCLAPHARSPASPFSRPVFSSC